MATTATPTTAAAEFEIRREVVLSATLSPHRSSNYVDPVTKRKLTPKQGRDETEKACSTAVAECCTARKSQRSSRSGRQCTSYLWRCACWSTVSRMKGPTYDIVYRVYSIGRDVSAFTGICHRIPTVALQPSLGCPTFKTHTVVAWCAAMSQCDALHCLCLSSRSAISGIPRRTA